MTPTELLALSDNELGCHASGGYGAKKRNEFYAAIRRALLIAAKAEPVLTLSSVGRADDR